MANVNILMIEDDPASQTALRGMLDAEEWRLEIVASANSAMQLLATSDWTLVVANIGTIGVNSHGYTILKELSQAPAIEDGKSRVRVLFLIPESGAGTVQPVLEQEHLPYVLKPINLHDVLEKVSDLLLEAGAIPQSIRQVSREGFLDAKRRQGNGRGAAARNTGMFAHRSGSSHDYTYSDEELAQYEAQQKEEVQRKRKNLKDLGGSPGR
jgi:DNA-binding NarL/FixJ family response regulator